MDADQITPNNSYDQLIFLVNNGTDHPPVIKWNLIGPLSGDLVAGILVGLIVAFSSGFSYFESDLRINMEIYILLFANGKQTNILIRNDGGIRGLQSILRQYHIGVSVFSKDFDNYHPNPNSFGWWINVDEYTDEAKDEYVYDLYQFGSPDFIQGFISMLNAFNIDFRDRIAGVPFQVNPATQIKDYYSILGYEIDEFTTETRIPAPIGAFYTGSYEDDPTGNDFD